MHNSGMDDRASDHRRHTWPTVVRSILCFAGLLVCAVPGVFAQSYPPEAVPPPLTIIDKSDRQALSRSTSVKDRTKLALDLMNERLGVAEKHFAANQFDKMFTELGVFQGILDDTLDFLYKSDNDSRRVLNNFKRFEMGLREFLPRIGTIRRDLPFRYEFYVTHLIEYVRDARTKALEPMFGDNVVRQPRTS